MNPTITPGKGPVEAAAALFDRSWPAGALRDLDPTALRRAALDREAAPLSRLTALQMLLSQMDAAGAKAGVIAPQAEAPVPEDALEKARIESHVTAGNLKDVLGMIYRDPETALYQLANSCRYHWERLATGSVEDQKILAGDPDTPVRMAFAGLTVKPTRLGALRGRVILGVSNGERRNALEALHGNLLEHAVKWYPAKRAYDDLAKQALRHVVAGRPALPAPAAVPALQRLELEQLRGELKTDAGREWVILRETNPIEAWRQAELRGRAGGASLLVDEYQSKWWIETRDIARALMATPESQAKLRRIGLLAAVEASAAPVPNGPQGPGKAP